MAKERGDIVGAYGCLKDADAGSKVVEEEAVENLWRALWKNE
jgi:hypothetical protein